MEWLWQPDPGTVSSEFGTKLAVTDKLMSCCFFKEGQHVSYCIERAGRKHHEYSSLLITNIYSRPHKEFGL